jgi:hypothetical protein
VESVAARAEDHAQAEAHAQAATSSLLYESQHGQTAQGMTEGMEHDTETEIETDDMSNSSGSVGTYRFHTSTAAAAAGPHEVQGQKQGQVHGNSTDGIAPPLPPRPVPSRQSTEVNAEEAALVSGSTQPSISALGQNTHVNQIALTEKAGDDSSESVQTAQDNAPDASAARQISAPTPETNSEIAQGH